MNIHKNWDIIISKGELEAIYSSLNNCQVWIKSRIAQILWKTPEEFENEEKEKKLETCIRKKSKYYLLDPKFFKKDLELLKTFVSIWVDTSNDKNWNEWNRENSYRNYEKNYASWLWEKLHLTKAEINSKNIEELETEANKYIDQAINHVKKYFELIPEELRRQFKSEYFEDLHNCDGETKSPRELLKIYFRLENDKKSVEKKWKINADLIKNNEIAKFEIQRIFALAMLYRDRKQNHEFQHLEEDESFIKNKLIEIFADKWRPMWTNAIKWVKSWTGLYDYTTTHSYWVSKNEDWTYNYNNEQGWNKSFPVKFNSQTISWYTSFYKDSKTSIPIEHIFLRTSKEAVSAVDKIIMKDYSSFTEILDHKWLIFVLDSYEQAWKLEQIIANELGTKETSFVEPIEFCHKHNHNSSNNYKVKKWIIKISYKAKDRKARMKNLKENITKLETELKNIDKNEKWIINKIKEDILYLKGRLKNLSYSLEVEIQIFDKDSYAKAEVDTSHPAYHGNYKRYQQYFDTFPKYFPASIYWEENLKKVIMPIIEEKFQKEWKI